MQTYDMLIILVLVAATLFGFWKGMAWQVASLASLIVSYFAALKFADQLAPMISNHAPWNKFVAMLAIYIGTSFVIWTAFRLVSGMIDRVKLDGFDHQMGALIGFAKGVLLSIAITFFAVAILPQAQQDMIIASRTGEYIVRLLDKTHSIVPPEIHDVIHPYVEKIEQRLDPNHQAHPAPNSGFSVGLPVGLPEGLVPSWPCQASNSTDWPPQPPQEPKQQQRPSAYDSIYDQQQSTWPGEQKTEPQPIAPWPTGQQTADRPRGAPL